jgi:hypothetical protein
MGAVVQNSFTTREGEFHTEAIQPRANHSSPHRQSWHTRDDAVHYSCRPIGVSNDPILATDEPARTNLPVHPKWPSHIERRCHRRCVTLESPCTLRKSVSGPSRAATQT